MDSHKCRFIALTPKRTIWECLDCKKRVPVLELAIIRDRENAALTERIKELEAKYSDLLMSVGKTCPGESRHETAKRYIIERESHPGNAAQEEKNNGHL